MNLKKEFVKDFTLCTERAAFGASLFKGKNDKIAADQSAVDEMRKHLNLIGNPDFRCRVVKEKT